MRARRAPSNTRSNPSVVRRRLIVVERGASLFAREGAEDFDETTAVTQLAGEPDAELAQRALSRIALAERSGRCFGSAMLFVGESGSSAARRLIGLGLAAHAAAGLELTELVVVAPANASAELRASLVELTDDLLFGPEHSPLPIRLCFAEPERQPEHGSGTFWRLPESE
jgi:hypothetical protein